MGLINPSAKGTHNTRRRPVPTEEADPLSQLEETSAQRCRKREKLRKNGKHEYPQAET